MKINSLAATLALLVPSALTDAQHFPSTEPVVPFSSHAKVVHGEPDFEKVVRFSQDSQIRKLGKGVAHLIISRESVCSGFLVARNLLMTNEHCVVSNGQVRQPSEVEVYMEYYEDGRRGTRGARGQEYIAVNEALDYALVVLDQPLGERYPILELSNEIPGDSGEVKVIQHPQGRSKEVSRRNAEILEVYRGDNVIHYRADTQGGSSGSPVFSLDGERVIALHHVGSPSGGFNEGVLMSAILEDLGVSSSPAAPTTRWQQLEQMVDNGEAMSISADRGSYSLGQTMTMAIDITRGGFLHIINISEQDEMTLLFPNQYHRDNRVSQGRMAFPTAAMPFELTASEPTGRQLVVALVTNEPLDLYSESSVAGRAVFAPVNSRSMGSMSRFTARSGDYWAGRVETEIVR